MATDTAAGLLVGTVQALSVRAPAVVAAAAREMSSVVLGLRFGDGTEAALQARHSRLLAEEQLPDRSDVEVYFDDRSLRLLFDRGAWPADQVLPASLDVRGKRPEVLAVWRAFQLLSQRASGLRAVQALWRAYRDRKPGLWTSEPSDAGTELTPPADGSFPPPRDTWWTALDYLDHRHSLTLDTGNGAVGGTIQPRGRTLWNGRHSVSWWAEELPVDADLMETLSRCKDLVRVELDRVIPHRDPAPELYDLMREYPSREGKGLRPTLTLATCVALGGTTSGAVRSAAAVELFHNGFLVHDDISDESTHRRGHPTLHEAHGIGLAVNAGDAMNLLAIDTVLSNLETLGLGSTLGLIHEILHMCRETVEGQAVELGWIRRVEVPERDEDYFHMSTKKTGWYTCISPCRLGAVCAGTTEPARLDAFNEVFRLIGIAFQIQDDVLNLIGEEALYGKEPLGDLLEGKRTVMMIHLFRTAEPSLRRRMEEIIRVPRSGKTDADAREMLDAMERVGSIEYAIALADRLAHDGVRRFETDLDFVPENEAKGVLRQIANYVTTRPL